VHLAEWLFDLEAARVSEIAAEDRPRLLHQPRYQSLVAHFGNVDVLDGPPVGRNRVHYEIHALTYYTRIIRGAL